MAKSKSARRRRREQQRTPIHMFQAPVRRHLQALRMESVEAYLSWCTDHGFTRVLDKSAIQRQHEVEFAARTRSQAALNGRRRERNPARAIARAIERDGARLPKGLEPLARTLRGANGTAAQRAFCREIVAHLAARAPRLLAPKGAGRAPLEALGAFLPALVRCADTPRVRPLQRWNPRSHNDRRALLSLAHHLFARWPTPPCLDDAWFEPSADAETHRRWFLALGAGASVRSLDLPILCTRRVAHNFGRAPRGYSVAEALRYAQVLAADGTLGVAEALRGTRLTESFAHEEFWSTFVQFVARHRLSSPGEVGAMIDYLQVMRFGGERYVGADGRTHRDPPELPQLSLAGRTPRSLLRDVEAWHQRLGSVADDSLTWAPSGLPGYRSESRNEGSTTLVRELLSGGDLRREGTRMHHCVATYMAQCSRGTSSIWTIEVHEGTATHKLLTVEVRNDLQRVVQARGKRNAAPCERARSVLERWAKGAGLEIPTWV